MIQPVPQHGSPALIPLHLIDTRSQIRTRNGFDKASLSELAASIREHGVLQPVVVTAADADGRHMLVIGERRLLAASMAGLAELPAMVTSGTPAELAARQAVENLQREDLHPADVIDGLTALSRVYGTWRDVARAVGKSPAWVSKRRAMMRLKPITAQVMREGWTADLEMLLALNQVEKESKQSAERLAEGIEAGRVSREDLRRTLADMRKPAFKVAPPHDAEDGEGADDQAEPPAKAGGKAPGLTLKLDARQASWLRHNLRECCGVDETQKQLLAVLDAWMDHVRA